MRVTAALLASALLALSSPLLFGFSRTSHLRFFPFIAFFPSTALVFNSGLQLWHISLRFVPSFFSTATVDRRSFQLASASSFSVSPSIHPQAIPTTSTFLHRSAAVFYLLSLSLFPRNFKFNDLPSSSRQVFFDVKFNQRRLPFPLL